MTSATRDRSTPDHHDLRVPAAEIAVQLGLIGLAAALVELLEGHEVPERALGTLVFAAGVAATILLTVGAWMGRSRRSRRVAAAVGGYAAVALFLRAVDAEGGLWSLGGSVAMVGVACLLLTSVLRPAVGDRPVAIGLLALVTGGVATVAAVGLVLPGHSPSSGAVAIADLAGWAGTGMAGLILVGAGVVQDLPLVRRAGLAFAALGGAHAVGIVADRPQLAGALELGAVSMLLVAAVPFLMSTVRVVGRREEASRARIAQAEAVMATIAERDHELRNVVAGLSGAAVVLQDEELGRTGQARRMLLAAGSELARLQAMLDGKAADPDEPAIGQLLRDLAVVHCAAGLDVRVEVSGRPRVGAGSHVVAQLVTNLLVNCARHAPGSEVVLRAGVRGRQVRIEVADNGPGLPPGGADALLRRGVRGPSSTGSGLGLAITAELIERHRGSLTLSSSARGCTAVIHLPIAGCAAVLEPIGA